ncbi:hypothetical protein GCM10023097_35630 [Streptomyces collinus]
MVAQQETPCAEAEDRGDPGDVEDRARALPVQRAQGRQVARGALGEEGEGQQGEDRDRADPDHEVQGVRRSGLAGEDVRGAPARRRADDQGERAEWARGALVHGRHGDTGEGGQHAQQADAGRPFAQGQGRDRRREHRLDLQDQGGQTGGHARVHADEEQAELRDAQDQADRHDPLPRHLRASHEEHRRERRRQEAQGGEEQGREVVQADLDDREVDAPDGGDQDGEGTV